MIIMGYRLIFSTIWIHIYNLIYNSRMKAPKSTKKLLNRISVWLEEKELELLSNKFDSLKQKKKFTLEPMSYGFLDNYCMRFLNCKSHAGVTPGQELMLVCGPPGIGKTQFIHKNLNNFAKAKLRLAVASSDKRVPVQYDDPVIDNQINIEEVMRVPESPHLLAVHLNILENSQLSFEAFLHLFQETAIKSILGKTRDFENSKQPIFDGSILLQILLENNSEEFILMYFKDYLNGLVNDLEEDVISQEGKQNMARIVDGLMTISQANTLLPKIFNQALQILQKEGLWKNQTEIILRLCLSILKKIQYEYRPPEYTIGYFRDGRLCTSFLLDILNFLAGLHPICKRQVMDFYENPLHKQSTNYILKGNFIDCTVILTNLSKLLCFREPSFSKWLDHLVLRTYNPSQLRTHIPIILELGSSNNVTDLLRLGRLGFECPTVLEIPGYVYGTLTKSNLMDIFSAKQAKFLWPFLGSHIQPWIEVVKAISQNIPEENIKKGKWDYCTNKSIKLRAQINKVFVHQKTRTMHDDNLRWRVTQQLNLLVKNKGNIQTEDYHTVTEIVEDPISEVLSEVGVTYNSYYDHKYTLSYQTDIWELMKIAKEFDMKNHGLLGKLKYWYWRKYVHYVSEEGMRYHAPLQARLSKKLKEFPKYKRGFPIQEYFLDEEYYLKQKAAIQPIKRKYYTMYAFFLVFVIIGYPLFKPEFWKFLFSGDYL